MSEETRKLPLSASADGKPILIAATATAGTLLHTATREKAEGRPPAGGIFDEVWLYLVNNSAADVLVTIEYGDAEVGHNIQYTVTARDGLKCVLPGLILANGYTIRAFAGTTNVVSAVGYVNQVYPA